MAEKTELETETRQSPEQAAQMLRDIADEISSGEEITVEGNNASITVPGTVEEIDTELEAEHEIKGEYDQVEVEVELAWTIISDDLETDEDDLADSGSEDDPGVGEE
jgi:amphi-Trp domain-containing protein